MPSCSRRPGLAFLYAVLIGLLGGLIGLGGAEFRLPTLAVALVTRGGTLSFASVLPFVPAVCALMAGAVVTAFIGLALASGLSEARLERVILVLLVLIGIALIIEGLLPQELPGFLPAVFPWHVGVEILFGLGIGLVSSLLGVAGGELIIPTLVFAFGADIK